MKDTLPLLLIASIPLIAIAIANAAVLSLSLLLG